MKGGALWAEQGTQDEEAIRGQCPTQNFSSNAQTASSFQAVVCHFNHYTTKLLTLVYMTGYGVVTGFQM